MKDEKKNRKAYKNKKKYFEVSRQFLFWSFPSFACNHLSGSISSSFLAKLANQNTH